MDRTEFIGKLQMCYVGDRNAFEEILSVYDKLTNKIEETIDYIEKNSGMISKFTGQKTTYVQEELTTDQLDELLKILKED